MERSLREALVARGIRSNHVADALGLSEPAFSKIANRRAPADRLEPHHISYLADLLRIEEPAVRELLR